MRPIIFCISLLLLATSSYSNNIQVSNTLLTGLDLGNQTYQIQFDLSWENSWRTSTFESNWDAAWVFIKYRIDGGDWGHMLVEPTNHVAPVGSTIDFVTGDTGVFIYRNNDGIGHVNWEGIELQWDYSRFSVSPQSKIDVCVFAVEMVYIPEGPFWIGDGEDNDIAGQFSADFNNPYEITSEAAIQLGGSIVNDPNNLKTFNGSGMLVEDDFDQNNIVTLPAAFPKGYDAFYMMKYEMSNAQYCAFLNKLTPLQAANNYPPPTPVGGAEDGFYIENDGPSQAPYYAGWPYHPVSELTFENVESYVDWAGLRVPTEMEWEKAARGPLTPVQGEFAWGNTTIGTPNGANYTLINRGQFNESISNAFTDIGNGNVGQLGINTPGRCGIFAASAINKNRQETGAAYYGLMEMSGNVSEHVVGIGTPDARAYTGLHGNGIILANGEGNISNYPTTRTSFRGGGRVTPYSYVTNCTISTRIYNNLLTIDGKRTGIVAAGCRAARSAN